MVTSSPLSCGGGGGLVVTVIIPSCLWFVRADLFYTRGNKRPREVKRLAQSHTARRAKVETQILSPDSRVLWCFCSPRFPSSLNPPSLPTLRNLSEWKVHSPSRE